MVYCIEVSCAFLRHGTSTTIQRQIRGVLFCRREYKNSNESERAIQANHQIFILSPGHRHSGLVVLAGVDAVLQQQH